MKLTRWNYDLVKRLVSTVAVLFCAATLNLAARASTISFSGYQWTVRDATGGGPGPNNWSPQNVFVDSSGDLHLQINKVNGQWSCAEVDLTQSLGFGTYQFQLVGRTDQFDPKVVLGLFTYGGADGTNEIDIEDSQFGNAAANRGNYTVYPSQFVTNYVNTTNSFPISLNGTYTTQRFIWASDHITFQSNYGHQNNDTTDFASWTFQPNNPSTLIPQHPAPVLMNLWLVGGQPPTNGMPVDLVVSSFIFTPAPNYYYWDGSGSSWNTAANWSSAASSITASAVAPGASDTVTFNTSILNTAQTLTIDGNQSVRGIIFTSAGPVTINQGTRGTLTLGRGGVTLTSGAGLDTINTPLSLTGGEAWTAAPSTTLAVAGAITHNVGSTVNFSNTGTFNGAGWTTALATVQGWATYGSGTSLQYATISGGNVAGLTGTAIAVGSIVHSPTANYDVSAAGTFGMSASFNTLRYLSTGAAGTIAGAFTANGLMNDGGALIFSGAATIGSTNELVITGPSNITLSAAVGNNGGGASALTYSGSGTLTLTAANTYSGGTTVTAGTLKFNITSGTPTIAAGVTATVASGATLELAGTVSALGSAGGNLMHISNNSTSLGLVVSGMNQVVGAIDGSGNTQVNAGSDLTADHIIQNALVIGGSMSGPTTMTIDASDALGNPLGETSGLALAGSLASSGPFGEGGIDSSGSISDSASSGSSSTFPSLESSTSASGVAAVPEPSTILLSALALLSLLGLGIRRPINDAQVAWFRNRSRRFAMLCD